MEEPCGGVCALARALKRSLVTWAFVWVCFGCFLATMGLHFTFGWFAYGSEQADLGKEAHWGPYLVEFFRDTFENWQSEYLQLACQALWPAFLYAGTSTISRLEQEKQERHLAELQRGLQGVGATVTEVLVEQKRLTSMMVEWRRM